MSRKPTKGPHAKITYGAAEEDYTLLVEAADFDGLTDDVEIEDRLQELIDEDARRNTAFLPNDGALNQVLRLLKRAWGERGHDAREHKNGGTT